MISSSLTALNTMYHMILRFKYYIYINNFQIPVRVQNSLSNFRLCQISSCLLGTSARMTKDISNSSCPKWKWNTSSSQETVAPSFHCSGQNPGAIPVSFLSESTHNLQEILLALRSPSPAPNLVQTPSFLQDCCNSFLVGLSASAFTY